MGGMSDAALFDWCQGSRCWVSGDSLSFLGSLFFPRTLTSPPEPVPTVKHVARPPLLTVSHTIHVLPPLTAPFLHLLSSSPHHLVARLVPSPEFRFLRRRGRSTRPPLSAPIATPLPYPPPHLVAARHPPLLPHAPHVLFLSRRHTHTPPSPKLRPHWRPATFTRPPCLPRTGQTRTSSTDLF